MKKNVLLTVVLALFAWTGLIAGTGTAIDPYTVAEAIAVGNDIPVGTHVVGYIVGGRYDDFDYNSNVYGISIADGASETSVDNCFQVKLATDQRDAWHPQNDASLIGKQIIVSGSGNGYGGYPAVENDVTIEFYTAPVEGAPVISNLMPEDGSVYVINTLFTLSGTVTTTDAAGLDSVCLAYGVDPEALSDTLKMNADGDTYSIMMMLYEAGVYYGSAVAYGANGLMTVSKPMSIIGSEYPMVIMDKPDYQIIVDSVNARGLNTHGYPDNSDDYYGASAYNGNFSVANDGYDTLAFVSSDEAIISALETILLPAKMPTAVVADTIIVTYQMYGGDDNEGEMTFACTSVSPLTFEVLVPEAPKPEIIGFTALADVTISEDNHILHFSQVKQLLPDSIELTTADETVMAKVSSWNEGTVAYDGTTVATYKATPTVTIPSDYTDTTATDFTEAQSIVVSIAQTVDVPATVASLDITFDTKTLEECKLLSVSGEKSWYLDVYEGDDFFTAYAKINTYGAGVNEAWLITPPVDMDALSNPIFTFDVASYNSEKTVADCGAEQFEVYYSTTPNYGEIVMSEWTRVSSVDTLMLGARWKFVTASVDVSAIVGDNVAFAFRHKSNDTNGTTWEVDNIVVAAAPASGIDGVEAFDLTVYPNPANATVQLSKAVTSVEFINLAGRTLLTSQALAAHTSIDVSSLSAGVYFVKVNSAEGTAMTKLIKE